MRIDALQNIISPAKVCPVELDPNLVADTRRLNEFVLKLVVGYSSTHCTHPQRHSTDSYTC